MVQLGTIHGAVFFRKPFTTSFNNYQQQPTQRTQSLTHAYENDQFWRVSG
jgi:hypothetical protein